MVAVTPIRAHGYKVAPGSGNDNTFQSTTLNSYLILVGWLSHSQSWLLALNPGPRPLAPGSWLLTVKIIIQYNNYHQLLPDTSWLAGFLTRNPRL